MSRRVPSSQHPLVYQTSVDNTDQATSSTACLSNIRPQHPQKTKNYVQYQSDNIHNVPSSSRGLYNNVVYDTGVSEDSCIDNNSYYNYYQYGKPFSSRKDQINNDCMFSDSDSSQLPDYEYNQIPSNRCSRNYSLHSFNNKDNFHRNEKYNSFVHKDLKKVYPNEENLPRLTIINPPPKPNVPFPIRLSKFVERPQSSLSSEVTSAIVDGCGGYCRTFENVCYYFLQVAFTMGILIGTSLCIAGAVLRKSASRNLQVLIYIGAILLGVSALLLAIQCNARCNARNRRKAIRNKRVAIPLETLHSNPGNFQQNLMEDNNERLVNIPLQNVQPMIVRNSNFVEHQGVPWWRRKDLT